MLSKDQTDIIELTEEDPIDNQKIEEVIITKDGGQYKLKGNMLDYFKAGFFYPGWDKIDYLQWAIDNMGWENWPIWGIKGSRKSNRLMKVEYDIYGDWDLVHKFMVIQPLDFANIMKEYLDKPTRLSRFPLLCWDDIGAWFDSQTYFENRKLYTRIKRSWTLMRTKFNCFLSTIPIKSELPGFVLRDINAEIFCTPNCTWKFDRWTWRMHYRDPAKTIKKPINIHKYRPFEQFEVPVNQFEKYNNRRVMLGDMGTRDMISMVHEAFDDAPNEDTLDEAKQAKRAAAQALAQARWGKK